MQLLIERTETTPRVTFDSSSKTFLISGWSSPENSSKFYTPIINWLNENGAAQVKDVTFTFKMNYFNSSSSKMLYVIFQRLEKLNADGNNIRIEWYYMNDDDKEHFEETFGRLIKMPVELVLWKIEDSNT